MCVTNLACKPEHHSSRVLPYALQSALPGVPMRALVGMNMRTGRKQVLPPTYTYI